MHKYFKLASLLFLSYNSIFCADTNNHKSDDILSTNGLLKNIVNHAPRISESEINEAEIDVVRSAHNEENKNADRINFCIKDYTITCPVNWNRITEDGVVYCVANYEYNGFCERVQIFENFTMEDKMNFESSCNVSWGCRNKEQEVCVNGRDYSFACPNGFIETDDKICVADIREYTGFCNGQGIKFSEMTNEEKEKWSLACDAYWPCYETCDLNKKLSDCPKSWKLINSFECEPENESTVDDPCHKKKSFKYFTRQMKEEFERMCNVRFECELNCNKNYKISCPVGWVQMDGVCKAPTSFDSCSKIQFTIDLFTEDEKRKFEEECSVEWPCEDVNDFCEINWSQNCPYGWEQEKKEQGFECVASNNSNYDGHCKSIIIPFNATEEMKRTIASSCDIPWPCKIESMNIVNPKASIKHNNQKTKESGPITTEGKIFRKGKYTIKDETNESSEYDIMK